MLQVLVPEAACRVRPMTISRSNRPGPLSVSVLLASGKCLGFRDKSQFDNAGRSVFGDRRRALDEAPPGAAALPDRRTAALARQARLKFYLQPANWSFKARLADGVVEAGRDPDRYLRWPLPPSGEIGPISPIAKLADESGLPGNQLAERSGAAEITAAYEQNRQDALATEVFGSPVDVLEGEGVGDTAASNCWKAR
jgi:hypothetical protein